MAQSNKVAAVVLAFASLLGGCSVHSDWIDPNGYLDRRDTISLHAEGGRALSPQQGDGTRQHDIERLQVAKSRQFRVGDSRREASRGPRHQLQRGEVSARSIKRTDGDRGSDG
jgi:hypothetical protein